MDKKRSGENSLDINAKLAKIFFDMADIYELKQTQWKPQAYRIAAQTLESLKQSVRTIHKTKGEKGLEALPGIGIGISQKIIQFIEEEKIDEYEKLKKSLPAGLYEIMNLEGMGAKKASLFYHKLGIKSVKELEKATKEHKIMKLSGFKQRAEEKILESILLAKNKKGKIPLKEAEKLVSKILVELNKLPKVKKAIAAGSLRRKKSMIRDLDIVVKTSNPKEVLEKFIQMKFVKRVIGRGIKKAIISTKEGIQVDVRVADDESFGACLLYFTGDKQHNIWLRKKAIKKGLKLNEYGLFKKTKRIAGKTEKEIYQKLGLKTIPPEKRIGEVD